MKTKVFFVLLSLGLFLFSACEKEGSTLQRSIIGVWEGKWGGNRETPQYFLKFKLEKNGQLQRLDEQNKVIATGTWSLDGIHLEGSYAHTADGEKHAFAGLYTDFDGTIIGTWGYFPSKANGGEIELKQQ